MDTVVKCATYSELPFDARAMSPPPIKIEGKKEQGLKLRYLLPYLPFSLWN